MLNLFSLRSRYWFWAKSDTRKLISVYEWREEATLLRYILSSLFCCFKVHESRCNNTFLFRSAVPRLDVLKLHKCSTKSLAWWTGDVRLHHDETDVAFCVVISFFRWDVLYSIASGKSEVVFIRVSWINCRSRCTDIFCIFNMILWQILLNHAATYENIYYSANTAVFIFNKCAEKCRINIPLKLFIRKLVAYHVENATKCGFSCRHDNPTDRAQKRMLNGCGSGIFSLWTK